MAFMHVITALAIVAAVATSTMAKHIVVGDYKGWTLNFDYQAWARQKEFYVGDRLSKRGISSIVQLTLLYLILLLFSSFALAFSKLLKKTNTIENV